MKNLQFLQKGFTLPEMLVVAFLTVVVGGALMAAINFFYRDNAYVFSEASATGEARRSVGEVLAAVRQATYGADGSYPLEEVEENRISLYSDSDNDGVVERIEYSLEDGVLQKAVTIPEGTPYVYGEEPTQVQVMAEYVHASGTPLFRYIDTDGMELAAPVDAALVRSVYMELTIDTDTARLPEPLTLEGSATLRNVRN